MTAFFQELFHFGFYKRSQGRIARQATFFTLLAIIALGAWRLHIWMGGAGITSPSAAGAADGNWWLNSFYSSRSYSVPLLLFALGSWAAFRAVQMPAFADFLISVEAEMNKVSWPARSELFKASLVVILMIFFLAALLATYDFLLTLVPVGWNKLLALFSGT
ncbi:MAG: preprotein translocase subunit SecE [Pirellulales bacterium]